MPATPADPGVHVTEDPSGHTITGVPTAITAFVGRALRGPVDEPVPIAGLADFTRAFGPLWRESGLGYAVSDYYRNGGGPALVVRIAREAVTAELALDSLMLAAHGPGAWANRLQARVTHPSAAEAAEAAAAQGLSTGDGLFSLELTLDDEVERFVHVSTSDGPRRVDAVLATSRLARVKGAVPTDRPAARPPDDPYVVTTTGTDGVAPDAASYFPAGGGEGGVRSLLKADLVNILVLPPVTPDGQVPDRVWADALAFARARRAFLIVDPPPAAAPDTVVGWITAGAGLSGVDARNAAAYFPRLREPDPLRDGGVVEVAASGAIAGLYARTDRTRGVWKAPAGLAAGLAGTLGPSISVTAAENGRLTGEGVNVIRALPGAGTVSWGARTLRGSDRPADDSRYVPVRRMALFLEESLSRGTRWAVFEPNDEPLWAQLRASVGAFLDDLFRRGAFQGATPREAYFVRCGRMTMTAQDLARGIVNIEVGFAPVRPAEFVVISLQQRSAANPA